MGISALTTILVPLRDTGHAEHILDAAFGIAGRFNSHVRVWHVAPDPEDALRPTNVPLPASARKVAIDAATERSQELTEAVRAYFRDYCEQREITLLDGPPPPDEVTASWHEATGKESLILAHRGRLADLIVVRQPTREGRASQMLEAALFESGQPILVVPQSVPEAIGKTIAIAWNGSLVAARAVTRAAALLAAADSVTVLTSDELEPDGLTGPDVVEELAWRGIAARHRTFKVESGSAGRDILAAAHDVGADLLVAGGFGRSQFREMILGGATRHFLEKSDLPLLIAH